MMLATDLCPDGLQKQCQTQSPGTVSETPLATTPPMPQYSNACKAACTVSQNGAQRQTIASAKPAAGRMYTLIDQQKQKRE